jgi:hypothetical protein
MKEQDLLDLNPSINFINRLIKDARATGVRVAILKKMTQLGQNPTMIVLEDFTDFVPAAAATSAPINPPTEQGSRVQQPAAAPVRRAPCNDNDNDDDYRTDDDLEDGEGEEAGDAEEEKEEGAEDGEEEEEEGIYVDPSWQPIGGRVRLSQREIDTAPIREIVDLS